MRISKRHQESPGRNRGGGAAAGPRRIECCEWRRHGHPGRPGTRGFPDHDPEVPVPARWHRLGLPGGTTLANVATVDLVQFAPAVGSVGNSVPVAGTGGDLTGGVVTAAVVSNSGNVTLGATSLGALSDGAAGDTIAFTRDQDRRRDADLGDRAARPGAGERRERHVLLTAPGHEDHRAGREVDVHVRQHRPTRPPVPTVARTCNNGRVTYTATMP